MLIESSNILSAASGMSGEGLFKLSWGCSRNDPENGFRIAIFTGIIKQPRNSLRLKEEKKWLVLKLKTFEELKCIIIAMIQKILSQLEQISFIEMIEIFAFKTQTFVKIQEISESYKSPHRLQGWTGGSNSIILKFLLTS